MEVGYLDNCLSGLKDFENLFIDDKTVSSFFFTTIFISISF